MIGVTLLAVVSAPVTWVIRDRERLIREREESRQLARELGERLEPGLPADAFTNTTSK